MAVTDGASARRLPLADESALSYEHPLLGTIVRTPGLSLAATSLDRLLNWGLTNSLWMFPMATSCCAIEFMAAAALASARGLEVSGHVHPSIHVHFGAALANMHPAGLEYMDPGSGLDGFHELLNSQLELRSGHAVVPDSPGLGIDWNWNAVRRYSNN